MLANLAIPHNYAKKKILAHNLVPAHVGCELQSPLAEQDTVADPVRVYPLSQLYITITPNVVLVGVPGNPLEMDGNEPQSTAVKKNNT